MTEPLQTYSLRTARARRSRDAFIRGWQLTLPAAGLLALTVLIPMIFVILLAFTSYQLGAKDLTFVGVANFVELVQDRVFWGALRNTLLYTAMTVPSSVLLGLGVALLVESDSWGRTFFRTVYFLPVTALLVAMATVWEFLLHPSLGLINRMLALVGIAGPDWLADPNQVLVSLSAIFVWQQTGYNMILFLAGLKSIPSDLYQAAQIDGADRAIDRFLMVTWPGLTATTLFVVVMTTLNSFRVFDTVATLTQGGPANASNVLLFNIYSEGFVYFRTGYASAMSMVFLALLLLVTVLQVWAAREERRR